MKQQKHYVVLDWAGTVESLVELKLEILPGQLARRLKDMARFIGGDLVPIALVAYEDQAAKVALKHEYSFTGIENLLPRSRRERVVALIDAENVLISLSKSGIGVDVTALAQILRNKAGRFGQVQRMIAATDWNVIERTLAQDVQRQFEEERVETLYEISMPGKSRSDRQIVSKIRELLGASDTADIFVLATGDHDFREAIETIQCNGRKVILWAVYSAVSPRLVKIADETEWIDDFLPISLLSSPTPSRLVFRFRMLHSHATLKRVTPAVTLA